LWWNKGPHLVRKWFDLGSIQFAIISPKHGYVVVNNFVLLEKVVQCLNKMNLMSLVKANFRRVFSNKESVRNDDQIWFTISYRWIPKSNDRRRLHSKWFKISSENGSVYRALSMSPNLRSSIKDESGEIIIDWQGWLRLAAYEDKLPEEMALKIEVVPFYEIPIVGITHPDPTSKNALMIAVLAILISFLSMLF